MIEYALLVALGFCIGGLIAFLLAPTVWHRAVRLTTKRLEATMPMSLSEIEADKDLLRASYAIRIRRLEAGLNKARDKSANQLVDISKLQMRISEMNGHIAALNTMLEERKNAANVFESTIRKRFPELENMAATAKAALDDRALEIADLRNKLARREEMLSMSQRAAILQQTEIARLREAMDRTGSDVTGRFKRRPAQWTLEEYRSEYDRLNVELSKLREQLILAQERETRQVSVLKTELQQLAERIMSATAARDRQGLTSSGNVPNRELPQRGALQRQDDIRPRPLSPPARSGLAPRQAKTKPWPETEALLGDHGKVASNTRTSSPLPNRAEPGPRSSEQIAKTPEGTAHGRTAVLNPSISEEQQSNAETRQKSGVEDDERSAKDALRGLLDRGGRAGVKNDLESKEPPRETSDRPAAGGVARDERAMVGKGRGGAETTPAPKPEPKLDQVFREILEGRPTGQTAASPQTVPVAGEMTDLPADSETATPVNANIPSADIAVPGGAPANSSKTQALLDRLKIMHNRQIG